MQIAKRRHAHMVHSVLQAIYSKLFRDTHIQQGGCLRGWGEWGCCGLVCVPNGSWIPGVPRLFCRSSTQIFGAIRTEKPSGPYRRGASSTLHVADPLSSPPLPAPHPSLRWACPVVAEVVHPDIIISRKWYLVLLDHLPVVTIALIFILSSYL